MNVQLSDSQEKSNVTGKEGLHGEWNIQKF